MSLLGGVRPPIAVLSALLLALAAVTALSLGRVGHDRIPEAVLTSQQQFAEDGAIAMRASVDESVTDLGARRDSSVRVPRSRPMPCWTRSAAPTRSGAARP